MSDEPLMDGDFSDEVTSAFFNDLEPEAAAEENKKRPKADPEEPEATRKEPKADLEEGEELEEEAPEPGKEPTEADPDDAEVDLKIGEETIKAKMRELKEAFAKRGEADKLHTEATQRRTQADAEYQRSNAALTKATEKAAARWKPYENFDWLALSRDPSIDAETFAAARAQATEALNEYRFFKEELDGVVKAKQTEDDTTFKAAAQQAVKELSDPKTGIEGWGQPLYQELLGYAAKNGAPQGVPEKMTASWAFRMMHKAMLYDRGVTNATAKLEKAVNRPTKLLKSNGGSDDGKSGKSLHSAMKALKNSGSSDDAADAFLASFED